MRRLLGGAGLVAGLGLIVSPVLLLAPARADAPGSGLGGYRISSSANGLSFLYNDGSEAQATFPYAGTDAAIGAGHALATVVYPGPAGSNPGATIQQFLGADLPAPIVSAAGTLSDPAKAEAYASGPTDATFPAGAPSQVFNGKAHAQEGSQTAAGTFVGAGALTSAATSTTTINAASVTTTAIGTVSNLTIAGVIKIGQVMSSVTASSDGTTPTGTATTTFSGVSIAGLGIGLNPDGVTLGPANVPLTAAVLNPVIAALGITITEFPATKTVKGPSVTVTAPVVQIYINPPKNGGNTFTILLGGATASAEATTPFGSNLPSSPPPATTPVTSGGTSGLSLPSSTPSPTGASETPVNAPFSPPITSAPASLATGPLQPISSKPSSDDYKGIAAGLVVLGLLVSGAGAFGLGKIPDDVLAEKASSSVCPLERSGP